MSDIVERLRSSGPTPSIFAVRDAADEIERLRAENEALKKDAERYRWLRGDVPAHSMRWARWRIEHWAREGPSWADIRWSDLDAAIDVARRE